MLLVINSYIDESKKRTKLLIKYPLNLIYIT